MGIPSIFHKLMEWTLQILGCNSAVPTPDRYPSSQVLDTGRQMFLIDCGEGTQIRMSTFKVKRSRIDHIFISHLHGDHVFGLPGIITSYNLYARRGPLHVYGPHGIREFLEGVIASTRIRLGFELIICEHGADSSQTIFEDPYCRVSTIPLIHRVPTTGYLFTEKVSPRRLVPSALESMQVPRTGYAALQAGEDLLLGDGSVLKNALVTRAGRTPLSYAYCSDTAFSPSIAHQVKDVTTLYHEATFLNDLADQARARGHSTAGQAAMIAREAGAGQLILGHFSSRYIELDAFLHEAREIFQNTLIAEEGKVYTITAAEQ